MQELFVGITPTNADVWDKPGVIREQKIHDLSGYFKKGHSLYSGGDQYMQASDYSEQCRLDKGYVFYPRVKDGLKASLCTAGRKDGGHVSKKKKYLKINS
mgnify:FL=1